MFIFIIVFIYIYIYVYTKAFTYLNRFFIYIYTPLTSSTISGIASNILGMLEHTGVLARTYQDNTSNTPGSYERLYRDWPKGYTGILAQGLAIGYVKTSVDWPHMPSQIKQLTIFLEMGMRSRAWVGRDRKHSENFSKKLDDIVKA